MSAVGRLTALVTAAAGVTLILATGGRPAAAAEGQALRTLVLLRRIGLPPFVEKVEGGRRGYPSKGGDMTEYLIAFNDEWVPDHTIEELREKSKAVKALVAEMKAAGVFIFTGGLDDAAPVFSVDASSGTPLFTDTEVPLVNGMEIAESGAVIRFNRGVVLTLDPAKSSEAAK